MSSRTIFNINFFYFIIAVHIYNTFTNLLLINFINCDAIWQ